MNIPKISAIIPVYNVVQYLEQCIDCVLNQTLQDFEVILINDGSTDGSGDLCDKLVYRDSRIRVIHKENEGSGPTRARGVLEATGQYIAFHDADDYFKPTLYEDLYNLAKSSNADLVISAAVSVNPSGIEHEISCKEVIYSAIEECRKGIMEFFPTSTIFDVPWNKLYKRTVATENNLTFKPLRRCQDAVWNLDFYAHCSRIVSTSKAYYYYRENTQESTWRKFPKDYLDIQIYYFTHLRELLSSWGMYNGWIKKHYDTSFILAIEGCAKMYDNPRWNMNRRERRDYVLDCISRPEVLEFIPGASIRKDQIDTFELIKNRDVSEIMRRHRVERFKDTIRQSRIFQIIWKTLKRMR